MCEPPSRGQPTLPAAISTFLGLADRRHPHTTSCSGRRSWCSAARCYCIRPSHKAYPAPLSKVSGRIDTSVDTSLPAWRLRLVADASGSLHDGILRHRLQSAPDGVLLTTVHIRLLLLSHQPAIYQSLHTGTAGHFAGPQDVDANTPPGLHPCGMATFQLWLPRDSPCY
jgi:hypothetical protein